MKLPRLLMAFQCDWIALRLRRQSSTMRSALDPHPPPAKSCPWHSCQLYPSLFLRGIVRIEFTLNELIRTEKEIVADLAELCISPRYGDALSFISFKDN